jgi:hypothetical protein
MAAGRSTELELHDLGPHLALRDANPGDGHRKREPSGTGTARIEVENPVAELDRGLMRVPRNHSGEPGDRRVYVKP